MVILFSGVALWTRFYLLYLVSRRSARLDYVKKLIRKAKVESMEFIDDQNVRDDEYISAQLLFTEESKRIVETPSISPLKILRSLTIEAKLRIGLVAAVLFILLGGNKIFFRHGI